MTELRIRAAEDADRDPLLEMAERLQEGVAAWREPDAVRRAVRGWVNESLAAARSSPACAAYVAERDGEVVGFVCASERAHFTGQVDTYIGELVVAKTAEGGGVGRALVAAAEDWGRSRGRARVVVDTGAANAPARRLYAALGYEEEDITVSRRLATDDRSVTYARADRTHTLRALATAGFTPGEVTAEQRGDLWVVTLRGEHDVSTEAAIRDRFDSVAGAERILVDLREATFIGSTTLGAIMWAFDAARARDAAFVVLAAEGTAPRRVLALTGLEDRLPVAGDEATARTLLP